MNNNQNQKLLFNDELLNRIIITGKLCLETQLHIGAGEIHDFYPEMMILTTHIFDPIKNEYIHDIPFIPAPTLKGIFRNEIHKILKGLKYDPAPCDNNDCDLNTQKICPVCYLFGSSNFGGKIFFKDSFPIDNNLILRTKSGITIDRKRKKVKEPSLIQIQTLQPKATFHFEIIIENLLHHSLLKYLIFVINELSNEYLSIGGKKSIGFGFFSMYDMSVIIQDKPEHFFNIEKAKKLNFEDFFKLFKS